MILTFEGNRNLVQELWSAVEQQRFGLLEQLFHPGVTYHGGRGMELRGVFQVAALFRAFEASFPGVKTRLEACLVEDDLVVSRVLATWELHGVVPRRAAPCVQSHSFMSTVRILDGRILEEWAAFGPMDLLRQTPMPVAA